MVALLSGAGFKILSTQDYSDESLRWFEGMADMIAQGTAPPVTFRTFLGDDFPEMSRNMQSNLRDRRIRTVSYICRA